MLMSFINEQIYRHGTGRISNCLDIITHKVLSGAPSIILTILLCKVKNFPLLEDLPQEIIPYLIKNESMHSTVI
jgi:hypothetical protein